MFVFAGVIMNVFSCFINQSVRDIFLMIPVIDGMARIFTIMLLIVMRFTKRLLIHSKNITFFKLNELNQL